MSRRARRAAAREAHPATGAWRPDLARLAERLAAGWAGETGPRGDMTHPRVAAAVLSARGATGEDRAGFARRLGLGEDELGRLEAGRRPPAAVPSPLRECAPWIDWDALEVRGPGGPGSPGRG